MLQVLTSARAGDAAFTARSLPRAWMGRPAAPEATALRTVGGHVTRVAAHQLGVSLEGHPGARPGAGLLSCGVLLLPEPHQRLRGTWVPANEAMLTPGDAAFLQQGCDLATALLEDADNAVRLVEQPFVLAELRAVYEAFLGIPLDVSAFNKRVTKAPDFLRPGPTEPGRRGRPARTYTRGSGEAAWAGQLPGRATILGT